MTPTHKLIVALALAAGWLVLAALPARAADPLDTDPEYLAVAAMFSNGRYDSAVAGATELLKRYPRHARLLMLLGDACERQGQPAAAARSYRAVLAAKPDARLDAAAAEALARLTQQLGRAMRLELTAEQTAAMSVIYPDVTRKRTEHFDIAANNPVLTDLLAQRAERVLESVRRMVLGDQLFPHRVELTVYPNKAAFQKAQPPAQHWSGSGFLFAPQPDGTIRRAVLLYQVDEQNVFRASLFTRELPHELTHLVLREYFGQAACPVWLDEGLASLAEADSGAALADRMTELLTRLTAQPLADMIDQMALPADRPTSFYVQSASFTRFLHATLTDAQMMRFLAQIKDGQKPSVALQRALFLDNRPDWLTTIEDRWHKAVLGEAGESNGSTTRADH